MCIRDRLYPEEHLKVYSESTPHTVLDLFNLLQQDRERGYVWEQGFFERGISTMAAPVRDHSGKVVAALGATIPDPHIGAEHLERVVAQVRGSADELSRLLDHAPTETAQIVNLWQR